MPLSRKNYLKKSNPIFDLVDVENKSEDLFDKLLSSPLKQKVTFQPLSFWENKAKTHNASKNYRKNSCWLYESSDSDISFYKSFDSEPSSSLSESDSSDNQTILENPLQCETNDKCTAGLKINNSTSFMGDVKLVTDKMNEMKLSNTSDSKYFESETEISQASEEDITTKNLIEMSLLLDSRLVTKRRKYNFSNSSVSPRTSFTDSAKCAYFNSFVKQSQYNDESFISDSKVSASTSQCLISEETRISPLIRNRHVAIRKRHEPERFREMNTESQESLECSSISTISSSYLVDICSTTSSDIEYQKETSQSESTVLEDSWLGSKVALKPGKKWKRSMSILKHYGNNSVSETSFQNSKLKGKKYKDFVESTLEMQSVLSKTLHDASISNLSMKCRSSEESFMSESRLTETENSLYDAEFSKSSLNDTFLEKTFLNRTVKVTHPEDTPSAFRTALGLEQLNSFVEDSTKLPNTSSISARDFILAFCNQEDILPFEEHFNKRTLRECRKIGEGVYGEVFLSSNTVIKIIPIEGTDLVNEEKQKTFEEIISEIVIASKLSSLKDGERYRTSAFSEMKRCWCVKGKYPEFLIKLWEEYDKSGRSENDSPVMFKEDQLYIILELYNGGQDLESFVFESTHQSMSIFIQVAFGLAVAEKAFEFEHRDLHWGNVLVSKVSEAFLSVILDGVKYEIPTRGVKVCIIDFTLSRITHEGCSVYNNLSVDPTIFAGEGDYQFDIYRMMLEEVRNDWSLFRPKNNLFWLHYMLDKMLTMVRYKNKNGKLYSRHRKDLELLKSIVLNYKDCSELVSSNSIKNLIEKRVSK